MDYDKAPMFYQYIESKGKEIFSTLNNNENEIVLTSSIFDGILKGTSHAKQTSGGYWKYKSGAPKVSANGNIWMKNIEYISYGDVKNMCSTFSSSSFIGTFKSDIKDLMKMGVDAAIVYLKKKGLKTAVAKALVRWLGIGDIIYTVSTIVIETNTFFKNKPYLDARDAKKGLIHAEYCTSYQGKWYSQALSDVWTSYSTAKEPNTAYGKGSYRSR